LSIANAKGFEISNNKYNTNKLTDTNGKFTIAEIEVWEVTGYILDDPFVKYDKGEIEKTRIERILNFNN
jgi:hypothetical protein